MASGPAAWELVEVLGRLWWMFHVEQRPGVWDEVLQRLTAQ